VPVRFLLTSLPPWEDDRLMGLTGKARTEIRDALIDAFDTDTLEQLFFYRLDDRLDRVTGGGPLPTVVTHVLQRSEQEGWTGRLVAAARDERPGNSLVATAAETLGLAAVAPAGRQLERMIADGAGMLDPMNWRGRLGQIETQVCRIEIPVVGGSVRGTGFLVGPDEVMTNHHVVKRLIDCEAEVDRVRVRFDYKRLEDGITVNPGTEVQLNQDWLIATAPPSDVDELVDPGERLPGPGELDFALIRLSTAIGDEPIGGNASPEAPARGWIKLDLAPEPSQGAPLLILQHPAGEPVKLAVDSVLGTNANKTRIRYRANTESGSSGSPCFDINLDLVALHHSGDPDFDPEHKPQYNEGVPVNALVTHLGAEREAEV
jgi:Effector-associated domain 1/Trypsin-like peptidase domain